MYSAVVVAGHLVNMGISEGNPVTQMKLQKMVYFAQGLHLALYNKRLVKEDFQAWKFGPVVPEIYQTYKQWGSQPITTKSRLALLLDGQLVSQDLDVLSDSAERVLKLTWDSTKDVSAFQLSEWSHSEGSPWQLAYVPGYENRPINESLIKSYFGKLFSSEHQPAI